MKKLIEVQLKEYLTIMSRSTPASVYYQQAANAAERLSLMLQRIEMAEVLSNLNELVVECRKSFSSSS